MTNKNNYFWIGIAVVVVIVLSIVFISNLNNNSQNENSPKQITLIQDNFAFVSSSYLNAQQYSAPDCTKKTCYKNSDGTGAFDCPKPDQLTLSFKILNLEEGVTSYSPKYKDLLDCEVRDGENVYRNQHFYNDEQTGLSELSLPNIDYSKSHNFVVCCNIHESDVTSNEICLSPVKLESLC